MMVDSAERLLRHREALQRRGDPVPLACCWNLWPLGCFAALAMTLPCGRRAFATEGMA
jgi:hypothetical protein